MSIGNTTLRVAQWIVTGIAALNIVFSIANGTLGAIPNIVFDAICCLLLIELLRRAYRTVRFWFGTFRTLDQSADNSVGHHVGNTRLCPPDDRDLFGLGTHNQYQHDDDDDSSRSYNPATGLPMMGTTDVGGHHWGCCD